MKKKNNILKKEIKFEEENYEISYDTKTLITILLLVVVYPVGLVLMFVWMKWSRWVKFLVVLPGLMALIVPFIVLAIIGSMVIRVGGDLINSGEFREIRRGMMNGYIEEVRPTEMEIKPTIKIIPLNR